MVDWMPSIEFVIFVSVSVIKNITQISRRTMNNRWRAMALVAAILDHFLQFPYEYQCIGMRLNVEAHAGRAAHELQSSCGMASSTSHTPKQTSVESLAQTSPSSGVFYSWDSPTNDQVETTESLPQGWCEQWDPVSERCYYLHEATGESSWKRPTSGGSQPTPEEACCICSLHCPLSPSLLLGVSPGSQDFPFIVFQGP